MRRALVPIGALVVLQDEVLGEGWNRPIAANDPTAHAEINALRSAAKRQGNYRLTGATLYVTLEPCEMCMGAMFHARVARLVYGATDPKKQVLKTRMTMERGLLAEECGAILSKFFAAKR
jgi:tRNA(adenine34) deaminase